MGAEACSRAFFTFSAALSADFGRPRFRGFSAASCLPSHKRRARDPCGPRPELPWPIQPHEKEQRSARSPEKLVYTVGDPACTAAGDDLDTGQLLVRQSLVELLENRPAVAVSHPDNGIGVVVNDDGDVLMPLVVAGLIDTDADKAIQPSGTFWSRLCRLLEIQLPTVCQSTRMKFATALLGRYSASQVTVRSNSLVKLLPG